MHGRITIRCQEECHFVGIVIQTKLRAIVIVLVNDIRCNLKTTERLLQQSD
jgi:hypothetical protein